MTHSPIKRKERIEIIDALRGFALFGILMVNMMYMYEPLTQMMLGAKPDAAIHHVAAESFVKLFFEGKFYVIFSMLFGFGFFIFLNKGLEKNDSVLSVFMRRLFVLFLFGIAHITLLWPGDVLLFYSLIGFVLILFRKATDKTIVRWVFVLALLPTILLSFLTIGISLASQIPEVKAQMDAEFQDGTEMIRELVDRATVIYSSGTFSEMISVRIEEYVNILSGGVLFFCPVILALFLIGFLAGRKGIITNYMNHSDLFRRIFWWGLGTGIITNILYAISYQYAVACVPDGWSLLASSMHTLGGISLGLCYISGFALLFINGKARFLVRYFAPCGRMALTNYLMHSFVCALLFYSYGLGLYAKVEVWQGIILTVIIFSLQVIISRWWLNHFRFGPLEWLWRSLTYLKFQPMKIRHV